MPDTKTPDVEVHVHLTLINGKLSVEYEARPNHVAVVSFALSMAKRRVHEAWEMNPESAECGAAAMKDWTRKQIAKRAGGRLLALVGNATESRQTPHRPVSRKHERRGA